MESFSHTNSAGRTYFLHQNGRLFYFSSKKQGCLSDIPAGYIIVESEKTSLPLLKKME
ncbi:MAG: hypothetical protein V1776_04905 [Candidatus Diapherotrites archaeon]